MRVQAAVVQAAPIGFDREQTMDKLERLIAEAARAGAQLAVFPEAFVPGYPRGIDFGTVVGQRTPEGRDQFRPRFVHSPTPWPDTTRPCWSRQGPRFSDRHRRAFGANRDFAGASRCTIQSHTRQHSARLSRQALSFLKFGPP